MLTDCTLCMDQTDKENIIEAWDEFAAAGFIYVTDDGTRRHRTGLRADRQAQLETRRAIFDG